MNDPLVYPLSGRVQHYPWGGYRFIPQLLGIENPADKPFAELWMGSHHQAPAQVTVGGERLGLDELLHSRAGELLGKEVRGRFGDELPFLFKILDARDMLSIQVHPSREEAIAGYSAEERLGIPLDAPQRNYKDRNHKPEVHIALGDFWMLHGFRPLEEIADLLQSIPDFGELAPNFSLYLADVELDLEDRSGLIRELYTRIMTMPQSEVDRILGGLMKRITPLFERGALKKISPHYWAVKAVRTFPLPGGGYDRGIFSIYLLNLVQLRAGEGTFQGAGVLHAYLEGTNVELMANSDNVLRGGLTPKHIDVPELLKTVDFSDGRPEIITGTPLSATERLYATPAGDFQLSCIDLLPGMPHQAAEAHGPEIVILLEGNAGLNSGPAEGGEFRELRRGDIFFAAAGASWRLVSTAGARLYRATVPVDKF
jgi:mannose-6-phosphate isomerase